MLQFKRPRRPRGLKAKSQSLLLELGKPGDEGWPDFNESFWRKLKPHFVDVQHDKCGYCEKPISDDGDVEHYRPKGVIQKLVAEGIEHEHSKRLSGRKRPQIAEYGYWWLAYEWENYLLSCNICNQKYKNALFPVAVPRPSREHEKFIVCNPKESDINREKPLLINPFETDLDPFQHFEYSGSGLVRARASCSRGLETIKVCGLHRISLVEARSLKAAGTKSNALMFLAAERKSAIQSIHATNIYFDGHEKQPFAGMVRIIFKQITTFEWSELKALIEKEGWMSIVEHKFEIANKSDWSDF